MRKSIFYVMMRINFLLSFIISGFGLYLLISIVTNPETTNEIFEGMMFGLFIMWIVIFVGVFSFLEWLRFKIYTPS